MDVAPGPVRSAKSRKAPSDCAESSIVQRNMTANAAILGALGPRAQPRPLLRTPRAGIADQNPTAATRQPLPLPLSDTRPLASVPGVRQCRPGVGYIAPARI